MIRLCTLSLLIPLLVIGCDRPAEPVEPVAASSTTPSMPATPESLRTDSAPPAPVASDATLSAQAVLMPTQGHSTGGELSLQVENGALRVTGRVTGLTTPAAHGFHIHEIGNCSAPDASSAGDHFNPTALPHGQLGTGTHHAGDMPNLSADAQGEAQVDLLLPALEIGSNGPRDVLGRAVVVHEQADDYTTQPSGNSGARIACGVITRSLAPTATETTSGGDS